MTEKEHKIVYLDTNSIGASDINPRKTFDRGSLGELADSIKEFGVLQPITVRPVAAAQFSYEIVCGERRWRAAQLAGLAEIPVVIRSITAEESMDIAITENLQRHDVSPLEEADAFNYLMANGKSISDLCVRFGKSDSYIRGRLKLLELIDEFRDLLANDAITMSQALEIAKFEKPAQMDMYRDHFEYDDWQSWRKLTARTIYTMAIAQYSSDLSRCDFDKSECETCRKCSKNSTLFDSLVNATCLDVECLRGKVMAHKVDRAISLQKKHPEASFVAYDLHADIVTALKDLNYDVACAKSYVAKVGAVVSKELRERIANREAVLVIAVDSDPYLGYVATQAGNGIGGDKEIIESLRKKDKRNKEIAEEKTIAEVRETVGSMDIATLSAGDITSEEMILVTFVLLHRLKPEQQSILRKPKFYSLSDEEVWEVVKNASPEQVRFIWRTAIINGIGDHIKRDLKTELFFDWVNSRDKEIVPAAEAKHNETYLQRHEKLEARIAAIELGKEA